jgi:hypothetical protein
MTHAQRVALRLSAVLLCVAASLLGSAWRGDAGVALAAPATQVAPAAVASFYGADTTWTMNAIKAIWPQGRGPFCGIETSLAAVNYDDEVHGVAMRFRSTSSQNTVAAANQTSGASQWGYPTPKSACGGVTNISRDTGTDPRSIAYMTWNYTPNNTFYHDYIYRWQFANRSAPSYYNQVLQATTSMARGLETWHEPLTAQINGGLHSVLVTGVYSYNDPASNYPAQIASVVYRDPMASPTVSRFQVSIGTWAAGHFSTPYGVYSLWSLYYGDRYAVGDRKNTSDPEPAVGIYVPNASHPVHWDLGFTWIQRDNNWANGSWNPDWAFTSTGVRMTAP